MLHYDTHARAKPMIRKHRQKIAFHAPAYSKEIPKQCTTATHTEAMHRQGVLGVFHPHL